MAARLAGVHRIFKMGGAQAVAALAYGTAPCRASTRSSAPATSGSRPPSASVFGEVDIDSRPGPDRGPGPRRPRRDPALGGGRPDLAGRARRAGRRDPASRRAVRSHPKVAEQLGAARALPRRVPSRPGRSPEASAPSWSPARGEAIERPTARPRAPRAHGRTRRAVVRAKKVDNAGGDLPRPLHARGGRRLPRRPEPRAADRRDRALLLAARRLRISEARASRIEPGRSCASWASP
jgi:hypothetical protein